MASLLVRLVTFVTSKKGEWNMRGRLFTLILAVAGVVLFDVGTPEVAVGFAGCNQICAGAFPGECVYYYASYFCHDANPPWYPCEFEYLEGCIKIE